MLDIINKAQPRTLYARRDVLNAQEIIDWAKSQGFETVVPPEEMHVTIAFSKTPVDWIKMGSNNNYLPTGVKDDGTLDVPPGGPRVVEPLGPDGNAICLLFACSQLDYRNADMRAKGASWDWPGYQPHITLTYNGLPNGVDLDNIEPYQGEINLGPEIFEEIDPDAVSNIVEKYGARNSSTDLELIQNIHDRAVALGAQCNSAQEIDNVSIIKVDKSLGLVFGYAIICKRDGQDYYDLNRDVGGERVPEHIPEQSMLEASTDFMENSRVAKEMHIGDEKGTVVFAFPLTTEIAKAMGISTRTTGLMIAMKPANPELLSKFESQNGEPPVLTGFSIGGKKLQFEDVEHLA